MAHGAGTAGEGGVKGDLRPAARLRPPPLRIAARNRLPPLAPRWEGRRDEGMNTAIVVDAVTAPHEVGEASGYGAVR